MIHKQQSKIGDLECVVVRDSGMTKPSAAVILCHGFGAPGTDLVSIAAEFISSDEKLAQAVYIFPAAPIKLDPDFDSRAWWMIDLEKIQSLMASGQTREMKNASPPELTGCRRMMLEMVKQIQSIYQLVPTQVIMGGFSQGAMLATDVALHTSPALGGLIVWSGALINEPEWSQQAKRLPALSIVQSHGRFDPILPISGARELHQMLSDAGHHVEYQEFDGPHTIPMEGFQLAVELIAEVIDKALT